jgi:hypothetical protein
MAQAGGKIAEGLPQAVETARASARRRLQG